MGYIVWDARNGRVIPAIGAGDNPAECVYPQDAAIAAAEQLNRFVLRNASPVLNALATEVKGPFYARPAALRSTLEWRKFGQ